MVNDDTQNKDQHQLRTDSVSEEERKHIVEIHP